MLIGKNSLQPNDWSVTVTGLISAVIAQRNVAMVVTSL